MCVFWIIFICFYGLYVFHWTARVSSRLSRTCAYFVLFYLFLWPVCVPYNGFKFASCLANVHFLGCHRPDDGGSKDLWNAGKLLPDYTVLQPRRQQSSELLLFVCIGFLTSQTSSVSQSPFLSVPSTSLLPFPLLAIASWIPVTRSSYFPVPSNLGLLCHAFLRHFTVVWRM
jgi:hypothetical protein